MEISENPECLKLDLDWSRIYTLRPITGIVLRDGFDKRVEQRITTSNEGKQPIITSHSIPTMEFWLKTTENEDISVRLNDHIDVMPGHVVTLIRAEQSGVNRSGYASLVNHDTGWYFYELPFAQTHILGRAPIEVFITMFLSFIPFFIIMAIGQIYRLAELSIYGAPVGILIVASAALIAHNKSKYQDKKIKDALKNFAESFYEKVGQDYIAPLKSYYNETYQMRNNINIENSYGFQVGDRNTQNNFSANEINVTPSKEAVGKTIDTIEKKEIKDKSFTQEIKSQVEKELKSYILGEVKTLSKSTAQWMMKLACLV